MRVLLFRVFFVIPMYIILNVHFFLVMGRENPLFASRYSVYGVPTNFQFLGRAEAAVA